MRRDVGRCVTRCEEPTFKQARLGFGARTKPTASMTGTRMLRFAINRRREDSWWRELRGSSRLERSESSPEPGSQAERRLNSTLPIPFILPLTMRGAVGYELHASPCNARIARAATSSSYKNELLRERIFIFQPGRE